MAGFNDTMELERSILNLLLKGKMLLRQYATKLKPEFFVSKERKLIRELIVRTYQTSKGPLTKDIFDYDVKSRIPDKDAHFYEMEWNLIVGMTVTAEADVIIDRLSKAEKGRQLLDAIEQSADMIEKGRIDEAGHHIKTAMAKMAEHRGSPPVVELTDYRHRLDVIMDKKAHPEKYLGIKTGFKKFDDQTGGLFPGELTLVSGITGLGKSTVLKQIETGIAKCNKDKNVLHICNEEHLLQVETKFDAQVTGIPYKAFKLATITDEEIEKWKKVMEVDLKQPGLGRVFIKEVAAFTDVTVIEEVINELENKGIKIHVVIIDHLPHVKPIEEAWGEYDEQGKAAADCKELARAYHIAVVTATQAATVVEEKQTKGRRAGKMDVYGSKEQVHVSNTSIAITLTGKDETQTDRPEWERDVYWLVDIKKNRDGATFTFNAKHHVRYGFVEEMPDEKKEVHEASKAAAKEEEEHQKKAGKSKKKGQDAVPDAQQAPVTTPVSESTTAVKPESSAQPQTVVQPEPTPEPTPEPASEPEEPPQTEQDLVREIIADETKNITALRKEQATAEKPDTPPEQQSSNVTSAAPQNLLERMRARKLANSLATT